MTVVVSRFCAQSYQLGINHNSNPPFPIIKHMQLIEYLPYFVYCEYET